MNKIVQGDIVEGVALGSAQHLAAPAGDEIIQSSTKGARINYCINTARWREVRARFNGLTLAGALSMASARVG